MKSEKVEYGGKMMSDEKSMKMAEKTDAKAKKMAMKAEGKAKKAEKVVEKKALSPWIKFVMAMRKKHPEKSYKEVLAMASKEYKK